MSETDLSATVVVQWQTSFFKPFSRLCPYNAIKQHTPVRGRCEGRCGRECFWKSTSISSSVRRGTCVKVVQSASTRWCKRNKFVEREWIEYEICNSCQVDNAHALELHTHAQSGLLYDLSSNWFCSAIEQAIPGSCFFIEYFMGCSSEP